MTFSKKANTTVLSLLIITLTAVSCWGQAGHMVVANIAKISLQEDFGSYGVRALAHYTDLLSELTNLCGEGNYPFVEAGPWMYKAELDGDNFFLNFKYRKLTYSKDGIKPDHSIWKDENHVAKKIDDAFKGLKNKRTNIFGKSDKKFTQSLVVRFMLGLVAYAHEPLQAIELFSKDFPEGDGSGKKYMVKDENNQSTSLYDLWAKGFGVFEENDFESPFLPGQDKKVESISRKFMKEYSRDNYFMKQRLPIVSSSDWVYDTFKTAKYNAYSVDANQQITAEYQENAAKTIRRQIALAGYRLANKLIKAWKILNDLE